MGDFIRTPGAASILTRQIFEYISFVSIFAPLSFPSHECDHMWWPLKGPLGYDVLRGRSLAAEAIQGAALSLQSIDDVHGGDGLPLGVFAVGDGISDDVLKEKLEYATNLLVDEARDTLHSTSPGQTADGRLGDALDVVTQHLSVTLGASFAETLASLATSRHGC